MYGRRLRALSIATAVTVVGAFALAFFYAPEDADQGFVQKIFYLHVPMSIVASVNVPWPPPARAPTTGTSRRRARSRLHAGSRGW